MPRTPTDVKKLAKDAGAKIVDLRFIDLPGMWQHFSIPVEDLDESRTPPSRTATVPASPVPKDRARA